MIKKLLILFVFIALAIPVSAELISYYDCNEISGEGIFVAVYEDQVGNDQWAVILGESATEDENNMGVNNSPACLFNGGNYLVSNINGQIESEFMVMAFVKFDSLNSERDIFYKNLLSGQPGQDYNEDFKLRWDNGNLIFSFFGSNLEHNSVSGNFVPEVNQWYHIAASYSINEEGSFLKIFVNGEEIASESLGNNNIVPLFIEEGVGPLYIGTLEGRANTLHGAMDEIKIYNHFSMITYCIEGMGGSIAPSGQSCNPLEVVDLEENDNGQFCITDEDCGADNQRCFNNQCSYYAEGGGWEEECYDDWDCGENFMCSRNECIEGCRADETCRQGSFCVDGFCEVPLPEPIPPQQKHCQNSAECNDDQLCNNRICVDRASYQGGLPECNESVFLIRFGDEDNDGRADIPLCDKCIDTPENAVINLDGCSEGEENSTLELSCEDEGGVYCGSSECGPDTIGIKSEDMGDTLREGGICCFPLNQNVLLDEERLVCRNSQFNPQTGILQTVTESDCIDPDGDGRGTRHIQYDDSAPIEEPCTTISATKKQESVPFFSNVHLILTLLILGIFYLVWKRN